jgi:16S rRNA (guanine966-N2)-methyltransferase
MRIISGYLKGRSIQETHGHRTHPMSEKMRGAIFNALGDIEGLTVLDAFAGTGALAFEAISRGASYAVAVDPDGSANRSIQETIDNLGLDEKVQAIKAFALSWSRRHPREVFDIVIFDPPYNAVDIKTMINLAKLHVKPGGIVVISLPPTEDFQLAETMYERLVQKQYGDASLSFYRRR